MTKSLQHKKNILDCLKDCLCERQLDDYYTCEECKGKSKAKKRHNLVLLPQVMILHIKRFDNNLRKINTRTNFPETLDISQ